MDKKSIATDYGYAKTSTQEQNVGRQMIRDGRAGYPPLRIYMDKLSGKDFEKPRNKARMRKLRPGDVLYIKSIDRIGRNYTEISAFHA